MKGCIDCGYKENAVALDFDHRDPLNKIGKISEFSHLSKQRLKEEIKKCDVRCSNCHRIKTHIERK